VIARIDGVLAQLPQAVKQAHERIIGERAVPNADKILSLYDADLHVIVRARRGRRWSLATRSSSPSRRREWWWTGICTRPARRRTAAGAGEPGAMGARFGPDVIEAIAGDRGFDSAANRRLLEEADLFNGLCPARRRRAEATAARGTVCADAAAPVADRGADRDSENDFLGRPLRAKGYAHRALGVGWSVLAHNLWVLARLETAPRLPRLDGRPRRQ